MLKFTKPAFQSPFSNLSAELNDHIFGLLSAERSRAIPQCRLVCQDLHAICSPHLIRIAVVADRPEALQKLEQLTQHPFFSKHVTHLLWDASCYDERFEHPGRYGLTHQCSPHLTTYTITSTGEKTVSQSVELDPHFAQRQQMQSIATCGARLRRLICRGGITLRTIDQSLVADLPQNEKCNIYTERFRLPDATRYKHSVYMVGYQQGLDEYSVRLRAQQSIRACQPSHTRFTAAIQHFPRLEHVSYSDFRALAYAEESYAELCKRMFNGVVCPSFRSFEEPNNYSTKFLNALRQPRRGSWKSLSIGDHPFMSNRFDSWQEAQERAECMLDKDFSALPAVDTLRVCVASNGAGERRSTVSSPNLGRRMPRLRVLELDHKHGDWLQSEWGGYKMHWDLNMHVLARRYVGGEKEPPHEFFRRFLVARQHDFENLQVLTLRNFTFEQAAMHDLLVNLRSLHTLHLLDCVSLESYEDFLGLTREKLSASLRLTGVEIYGVKFFACHVHPSQQDEELKDRMRVKRNLDYDIATLSGCLAEFYPFTAGSWPCERPELEAAMMGGRPNNVLRKAKAAPNQEARDRWAEIPVQDL